MSILFPFRSVSLCGIVFLLNIYVYTVGFSHSYLITEDSAWVFAFSGSWFTTEKEDYPQALNTPFVLPISELWLPCSRRGRSLSCSLRCQGWKVFQVSITFTLAGTAKERKDTDTVTHAYVGKAHELHLRKR